MPRADLFVADAPGAAFQPSLLEGTPLREVEFVVVDLETTGGSPNAERITEVGAVRVRGGEVLGEFATLVNPGRPIPPTITVLTGITDAMVVTAPREEEVLPSFLEFARGAVIVAALYFGLERTKELVRQTIFELAVDRSDEMRAKARAEGVCFDTVKDFRSVTDLPKCGWIPEWGADHCPYGQVWREYAKEYPWFLELAPYYCDVIDTTTIENFSCHLSHRLVQNVIISGESCEREYFESEKVREGAFTYGSKND